MNPQDPNRWSALAQQLTAVTPELCLFIGMCAVILAPMVRRDRRGLPIMAAVASLSLALLMTLWTLARPEGPGGAVFSGMMVIDPFSQFFKVMLLAFTLMVVALWLLLTRPDTADTDVPDYLCLLLGATAGMAMMASASHLVMIYLAMETASLPSYVLAGFRKHRRQASESTLKYVIFGSVASAIMLYGMSLIYGSTGTLDIFRIALSIGQEGLSPLLALGLLGMLVGLAFKMSAVPMHFWTPDVFQAAPHDIAAFLSVASKGAGVCLLVRLLDALAVGLGPEHAAATGVMLTIGLLGAATATWGNLVALRQMHIRRMLAYSSIAHAGYMMMTASVLLTAGEAGDGGTGVRQVVAAILFYLFVYVFMNLGAFAVAGLVARQEGHEDIRRYAGLMRRSPALAVLLTAFLLSLFGMPGLGGFMGKILIAVQMFAVGPWGYALVAILLANTLMSFYVYFRPVYYMAVAPSSEEGQPSAAAPSSMLLILSFCALMLLWTGLLPGMAQRLAYDLARIESSSASAAPALVEQSPQSSLELRHE